MESSYCTRRGRFVPNSCRSSHSLAEVIYTCGYGARSRSVLSRCLLYYYQSAIKATDFLFFYIYFCLGDASLTLRRPLPWEPSFFYYLYLVYFLLKTTKLTVTNWMASKNTNIGPGTYSGSDGLCCFISDRCLEPPCMIPASLSKVQYNSAEAACRITIAWQTQTGWRQE